MLKFAIVSLVVSLIAGTIGMTNTSAILRRIAIILFALFFLEGVMHFSAEERHV
jgi:uncharacterized membrane protein YtjA (UPF0391 family)